MTSGTSSRLVLSGLALVVMFSSPSACSTESTSAPTVTATPAATAPPPTATIAPLPPVYSDPFFQPDGNRLAGGSGLGTGFINEVTTRDTDLDGTPTWVTGVSTPEGDVWAVALADGTVVGYRIPLGGEPVEVEIPGDRLVSGQPPLLAVQEGSVRLAVTPANAAPNSIPVYLAGNRAAYVDNLQRLTVLEPDGTLWRPDLEVLPDSRVIQTGPEQVLVLAEPTDRYPHAVLGDTLEATSVVSVIVGSNEVEVIYQSEEYVIESIAPLLADLNGDGANDIALTISDDTEVRVVVVSGDGDVLAMSGPEDRLLGWRQLVAVGPLGPNGETEIAEVLNPDTDGTVRFLRRRGKQLEVAAAIAGYRTHQFGSRNLEQAVAADIDRDGHVEVIVPTPSQQAIAGVRHGPDGAVEMWARPLGGTLATNIAVLTRPDGTLTLAAATQEGSLRVWQ